MAHSDRLFVRRTHPVIASKSWLGRRRRSCTRISSKPRITPQGGLIIAKTQGDDDASRLKARYSEGTASRSFLHDNVFLLGPKGGRRVSLNTSVLWKFLWFPIVSCIFSWFHLWSFVFVALFIVSFSHLNKSSDHLATFEISPITDFHLFQKKIEWQIERFYAE